MRILGGTTDDAGYYCPETRTVTDVVTDISYERRAYKYLGMWQTYTTVTTTDQCFNAAKNGNYLYFQLLHYSGSLYRCYLYPYEGTAAGQGGYNVYKVISTQRQVSRQETTTWVAATGFDTFFGIGAHCCSTGYVCTDCQIGKYNDVEGELECRFCDNHCCLIKQ